MHSMFLTLLAGPIFKGKLSEAYCDTYTLFSSQFAKGVGSSECSCYTLSVQFLNRQVFVWDLVSNRNLLQHMSKALLSCVSETLNVDTYNADELGNDVNAIVEVNLDHGVMSKRRYIPIISDLKCVLNVDGVGKIFRNTPGALRPFLKMLTCLQYLHPQRWAERTEPKVEWEDKTWIAAFNASIR